MNFRSASLVLSWLIEFNTNLSGDFHCFKYVIVTVRLGHLLLHLCSFCFFCIKNDRFIV